MGFSYTSNLGADVSARFEQGYTGDYTISLPGLKISIPLKSESDALLLASFMLEKGDVPLHIIQSLIHLLSNPPLRPAKGLPADAEDNPTQVSTILPGPIDGGKPTIPSLPEDVISEIASRLYSARTPFAVSALAQENAATLPKGRLVLQTQCPRMRELIHMSLVARKWTASSQRFLWRMAKVVGSDGLRNLLASPRAGPCLRELYVIVSPPTLSPDKQVQDDLPETLFLLRNLLRKTPNLEAMYFQTSTQPPSDDAKQLVSSALRDVFSEISHLSSIKYLWLTHIPGPVSSAGCEGSFPHLEKLYAIFPRMQSLKKLWVHNWREGRSFRIQVPKETSNADHTESSLSLCSLSFRLGRGGVSFDNSYEPDAAQAFVPLSRLFSAPASINRMHLLASNLFIQYINTPSALLTALIPPPPRLSSLRLTMDTSSDTEFDAALFSARFLLPSEHLTDLTLVFNSTRPSVPQFRLPPSLRTLHVHCTRTALDPAGLRSRTYADGGDRWWRDFDTSLFYVLRYRAHDAATYSSSTRLVGRKETLLGKVVLTIDPTPEMLDETECGLPGEMEPRWDVEGPSLVTKVEQFCAEYGIEFECYRTSLPVFE